MGPCLDDETLSLLIGGGLPDAQVDAAHQHAEECERCRALLIDLALVERAAQQDAPEDPPPADDTSIAEGTKLDQYTITRLIGEGGMGQVFAADDETLGRSVAIKVVRPRGGIEVEEGWSVRLVREAQAMAKLTHPNVLTVYGVGTRGASVYVAMELVEGQTLGEWVAGRSWRQILAAYADAGRGLAAAHEAGLVHRDFKPSNVLVNAEGRVQVTDFGLVARADEPAPELPPRRSSDPSWDENLTHTGALVGTPAYMAPEQFEGGETDPRTDQFSFCVALWEALFGEKPFVGDTGLRLAKAVTGGERRPLPRSRRVPVWLRRAIDRGLKVDPQARWPSMDALLVELQRGQARGRRAWTAAGAVMLLGAAGALWWSAQEGLCDDAALHGVWDEAQRAAVEEAMLGIGLPYARRAWENTDRDLGAYAEQWTALYRESCGEAQSVAVMRIACLERAKVELGGLVEVLTTADDHVVRRAHELLGQLPPLEGCADAEQREPDLDPPPPDEAGAVEDARARLAQARAELTAGRYADAHKEVEAAKASLADVAYRPVLAELALAEGRTLDALGEYDPAVQALERALELAGESEQRPVMARAAASLLFVVGQRQRRPKEGLRYLGLARGLAKGDPTAEANLHSKHATVLRAMGDYAKAEEEHRRALALREGVLGSTHPEAAGSRNNLATVLHAQGKYDEAEALLRRALTQQEEALGAEHPGVATTRNNLAVVLKARGEYEEAEAEHRRALALREAALGPDHPDVAESLGNLALVLKERGKYDEAETNLRQALLRLEKAVGAEHPSVAQARNNLAVVLRARGRFEAAADEFRLVIAVREQALGADHPDVASARNNLAAVLYAEGKHAEAEQEFRRALSVQEKALGPDHPAVARSRHNLATVLIELDRAAEAEEELRRALAVQEKALGQDHPEVAGTCFNLARLLLRGGRKDEAVPLAERALAIYRTREGHAREIETIEAWLSP